MEKEVKIKKRLTAGEYRAKFGISRTRGRLLDKYGVDGIGYAIISKKRRDALKVERKAKADRAKAGKKVKIKK